MWKTPLKGQQLAKTCTQTSVCLHPVQTSMPQEACMSQCKAKAPNYKVRVQTDVDEFNDKSQRMNWQQNWAGSDRLRIRTNVRFCGYHSETWRRVMQRSLLEQSQHTLHAQGLETTHLGLPPSLRWKWTSSRGNKAIFNSPPPSLRVGLP